MIEIIVATVILGGLGLVFGAALGFFGEKLKVIEDKKLTAIKESLPGANCGGCGRPGCASFAEDLIIGHVSPEDCPVGGAELNKTLAHILGVEAAEVVPQTAFIACLGDNSKTRSLFDYSGMPTCKAQNRLPGGSFKSCPNGCLGAGDCKVVCKFDAIEIKNGLAVVIQEKCTGCKACVATCPKKLISMERYKPRVRVACASTMPRAAVRKNCEVGCIVCGLCHKRCAPAAITIEKFLPVIDYDKCVDCGVCVNACPRKCIINIS